MANPNPPILSNVTNTSLDFEVGPSVWSSNRWFSLQIANSSNGPWSFYGVPPSGYNDGEHFAPEMTHSASSIVNAPTRWYRLVSSTGDIGNIQSAYSSPVYGGGDGLGPPPPLILSNPQYNTISAYITPENIPEEHYYTIQASNFEFGPWSNMGGSVGTFNNQQFPAGTQVTLWRSDNDPAIVWYRVTRTLVLGPEDSVSQSSVGVRYAPIETPEPYDVTGYGFTIGAPDKYLPPGVNYFVLEVSSTGNSGWVVTTAPYAPDAVPLYGNYYYRPAHGLVIQQSNNLNHFVPNTDYYLRWRSPETGQTSRPFKFTTANTGGGGGGGGTTAPDAPGVVVFDNVLGTSLDVIAPGLPARATSLSLLRRLQGGSFEVRKTDIQGGATVHDTVLVDTIYEYAWRSVNTAGTTDGPIAGVKTDKDNNGADVPDKPDAPSLKGITPTSATITSPEFPSGTETLRLYRRTTPDGAGVLVHTYTTEGDFEDVNLTRGSTQYYYVIAANLTGQSPPSDNLEVALISLAKIVWVAPANNSIGTGTLRLVVDVDNTNPLDPETLIPLDPQTPVIIRVFGGALPNIKKMSGGNYKTSFDTLNLNWQGVTTFTATVLDAEGFESAPALLNIVVDNTLVTSSRWHDELLTWHQEEQKIASLMVHSDVYRGSDPSREYWWRVYVVSPNPQATGDYSDYVGVKEETLKYQPIALDTRVQLLGTPGVGGEYRDPDHTARIRFEAIPVERLSLYATKTTNVVKMRYKSDDVIEVFGTDPAKYFEFNSNGLELVCDLSREVFGLEDATDATRVGDKLHVVTPSGMKLVDLDTDDVSLAEVPLRELRTPVFVETVDDVAYWVYNGPTSAHIYRRADSTRLVFALESPVVASGSRGDKLALATANNNLYVSTGGEEPELVYTHTANISTLHFNQESVVMVGDVEGRVVSAATGAPVEVADLPEPVRSIGEARLSSNRSRGFAGTSATHLYRENIQALYLPSRTLPDAKALDSMHRHLNVLREEEGKELQPGYVPPLSDESLLIGVSTLTPQGGYIARLQESEVDPSTAYRGERLGHVISSVLSVLPKKEEEVPAA